MRNEPSSFYFVMDFVADCFDGIQVMTTILAFFANASSSRRP